MNRKVVHLLKPLQCLAQSGVELAVFGLIHPSVTAQSEV